MDSNHRYSALSQYLEEQGKESDPNRKNIIDNKTLKGAYHIKNEEVALKFFSLYQHASDLSPLRIQERPLSVPYSGIFIDIDMKSKDVLKIDYKKFVNACVKEFEKLSKADKFSTTAFLLKRHKAEMIDNEVKDGIHLIFPCLLVSQGFKKKYLENLLLNKSIQDVFKNCTNPIKEIVDQALSYNQLYLYNSCKSETKPYVLQTQYKIRFSREDDLLDINKDETEFKNLALEMSVMYQGTLKQRTFKSQELDNVKISTTKHNNNENRLARLKEVDSQVVYILEIINVLPDEIFKDGKTWKDFVKAIANISLTYKPVAIYGSQRCPEEFEKPKTMPIINDIFAAADSYGSSWGMGKLINWVKEYAPTKMNNLREKNILKIINDDAFATAGNLSDDRLTKILKIFYDGKWKTTHNQDMKDNPMQWYNQCVDGPHAFKWKGSLPNKVPHQLFIEMADQFGIMLTRVIDDLKTQLEFKTGNVKAMEGIINNLIKKRLSLEDLAPKERIIKTLGIHLTDDDFFLELNKHHYAIGVNGGILLMPEKKGEEPRMIRHENNYNVSLNIGRTWKPYDPEDPDIKEVFKVINEGFYIPKELDKDKLGFDKESRDFYLFHICRGLTKKQKDPIMLHTWGGGGNIKSTLEALEQNTFGQHWCCPIEAEYLAQPMPPANAPHPKLMNMKDKHFVTFTEAGKGRVLNEAKLKYLLSPGENKTARGLYINDLYFMLYAVFTTRSNYLLSINTTDHAIWRRQLFMFCEMTFVEKEAMFEPWHREINTYYIEEWVREKRICDAYFRILVHYNYVLLNEYDGKLKKVPHDRIKEWTKNIRNEQDQMKRYTNARLIKKKDESKTITIDDAVENFIVWYKKTDNSDPLSIFPKLVTEKLYHSEIKFDKETGIAKGWAFKE